MSDLAALSTTTLRHGRIELALHRLRDGEGPKLLLLHGLGEHTPSAAPTWVGDWPGPIYGLDFTGHGMSSMPRAGGYTAEALLADTDAAIAELGSVSIVGRGLGGYVALLIAGARPSEVRGVVIDDGPGLAGGGSGPTSPAFVTPPVRSEQTPDPFALLELARDIRPEDYALNYARFALASSGLLYPIIVSARISPDWLTAVTSLDGVVARPYERAFALLCEQALEDQRLGNA